MYIQVVQLKITKFTNKNTNMQQTLKYEIVYMILHYMLVEQMTHYIKYCKFLIKYAHNLCVYLKLINKITK